MTWLLRNAERMPFTFYELISKREIKSILTKRFEDITCFRD
jgi:hypothetical protein